MIRLAVAFAWSWRSTRESPRPRPLRRLEFRAIRPTTHALLARRGVSSPRHHLRGPDRGSAPPPARSWPRTGPRWEPTMPAKSGQHGLSGARALLPDEAGRVGKRRSTEGLGWVAGGVGERRAWEKWRKESERGRRPRPCRRWGRPRGSWRSPNLGCTSPSPLPSPTLSPLTPRPSRSSWTSVLMWFTLQKAHDHHGPKNFVKGLGR